MSQPSDPIVGIDLGTTNSAVAAVIDGRVQMLPVHGQSTMPSAVGLDPSGQLIIGQPAKNQSIAAPEATILSIKRLMGAEETVQLGGKEYRPEEISALILGELKRAAEAHLNQPISRAVITVPAFFNERQRQATQDAGRLAGLEVMRIINEPTAAALAYGAGHDIEASSELLLVYDLGGGTFDVSLVSVENGVVEVRASHGDTHLGGDDFDEELVKIAAAALGGEKDDRQLPAPVRRRLKAIMEVAKIRLSDEPYAKVREEYVTEAGHLETEIDRLDYESAIVPLLERTLHALQRALQDGGVSASQIQKTLLVGGATRTPAVQELLRRHMQVEPSHEINPDLIVAMGAAIQGAALAGQPTPAVLVDITAHTYSTEALSHYEVVCVPIIRRGTALPAKRTEAFYTSYDEQEAVDVKIFQGESDEPAENLLIGEFRINGLAKVPQGNVVLSTYQIDLNGLLTVTATEKATGLAKSVTIDTASQHRLDLESARAKLAGWLEGAQALDTSDTDPVENEAPLALPAGDDSDHRALLASVKSLRQRATTLLETGLPEVDATSIQEVLTELNQAIQQGNWEQVNFQSDRLSDLLFYLDE